MPNNFALQYYQIITILFIAFVLFISAKVVGAFLENKVKQKMTPIKPLGTQETCGDCIAMQTAISKVPRMDELQQELRKKDLPEMKQDMREIKTNIESLDGRVKKLFSMIEDNWKEEIKQLRQALHDKNEEIARMKLRDKSL